MLSLAELQILLNTITARGVPIKETQGYPPPGGLCNWDKLTPPIWRPEYTPTMAPAEVGLKLTPDDPGWQKLWASARGFMHFGLYSNRQKARSFEISKWETVIGKEITMGQNTQKHS